MKISTNDNGQEVTTIGPEQVIITPSIDEQNMLINLLSSPKLRQVTSALFMKHGDNIYNVKIRPGYEDKIIGAEFVYARKGCGDTNIRELCDSVCGKYVLYDITGWKLGI